MILYLQPEPELGPVLSGFGLALQLATYLSLVGLVIQEYMRARSCRRLEARATRAAAAERISARLCWLSELDAHHQRRACKGIVADLLALVSMAYEETDRSARLMCLNERYRGEEDDRSEVEKTVYEAIYKARREAIAIHRRLELASFFLSLGSQTSRGLRLTLDAVERYVSTFTPMVQELHEKDARWRYKIPLFEIRPPEVVP